MGGNHSSDGSLSPRVHRLRPKANMDNESSLKHSLRIFDTLQNKLILKSMQEIAGDYPRIVELTCARKHPIYTFIVCTAHQKTTFTYDCETNTLCEKLKIEDRNGVFFGGFLSFHAS